MSDDRDPVDLLAEEFADRLRRGERPSVSDYASKHPEHAEQIRAVLPAVARMEQLKQFRKSTPSTSSDNLPDRLGDFRIVRELGRGGMGVVFEAVQESLGRRVALKVLASHAQMDPERRERFVREAKAAARLHHTNIVPVFGVGEQDGLPYYVMQLIDGHGLNTLVKRWHEQTHGETRVNSRRDSTVVSNHEKVPRTGASLPPPPPANGPASGDWSLIASIGMQTAQALDYAHRQGVLHRDIKPANLLLDDRGEVWVVDFGLAKLANYRGLTATGHIVGTLQYLAPECLHGKADARSDVYGLGATLYELLTLAAPFDGENPAQIMKLIADSSVVHPRKLNPHIPRDLETIILTAMNRDPNKRYATAKALADDLEAFLDDRPIRARRETLPERAWRWARHHPAVASLSCCTAAALVLAAALGWSGYVETKKALAAEAKKRDEAETASAKLKANLTLSLEAFEKVFIAAGGDDFRPRGPMGPPPGGGGPGGPFQNEAADKASVLEAVLAFYDKFADQNATDGALRFEAAKAHRRVGEMHYWLSRGEKSQAAFKRAKSLLDGVYEERKDDPEFRYEWMLWHSTSPVEPSGAEAQLVHAVEFADSFTAPPRQWSAGSAYMRLGVVREQNKNPVGAEAAYTKAIAKLVPGPERKDLPPNVMSEATYCKQRLAQLMVDRGSTVDAKAFLERTADELRVQSGGGPQGRFAKESLSSVLRQLAEMHQKAGEEAIAARLRLEAQKLLEGPGFGGPFGKGPPKK